MRTLTRVPRWLALLGALAVGGPLAGGVVAAQFGSSSKLAELQAAIDEDPLVHVADIPAGEASRARAVFLQLTSTGHLCLWDAPSATSRDRRGGCNPADDPFSAGELRATLTYEGGPGIGSVRDARVFGLASAAGAEVYVAMSDGSRRQAALRDVSVERDRYRAFVYRVRPSDLRKGIGPVAVVAVNEAGREIGRQPTGFAG